MSLAAQQLADDLMAVPAFIPAMICPGYLAAWFLNLFNFTKRSVVERLFWSVPLSLGLSTIVIVLIARYISLFASSAFLWVCAVLFVGTIASEFVRQPRAEIVRGAGIRPLGGTMFLLIFLGATAIILSLVDLERGQHLYSTLFIWDHAYRVAWTESVLRTGVPPANPLYFFHAAAPMRNYYYWYVLCAAIAQISHLPARAVVSASCVWTAVSLCCLTGLYLKHFLHIGQRLRRQVVITVCLLSVTGLDICVNVIQFFMRILPLDLEWWSKDPFYSWFDSIMWVPHHVAALVCCMFSLLLAYLAATGSKPHQITCTILIGASLASAFGMSIFVPFAFFLVMIVWGLWQIAIERVYRPVLLLAVGGTLAASLIAPFLLDLAHNTSKMSGGHVFGFHVREIIPPEWLVALPPLQLLAAHHPMVARVIADWILLLPGFAIELGFFALVLLVFLTPRWRSETKLTPAHRSLVVIAIGTIPLITLLRSWVLITDDFGWRGALILQFPLLLLGSELVVSRHDDDHASDTTRLFCIPPIIRSLATIMIFIGVFSTASQALTLRFDLVMVEAALRRAHHPQQGMLSHFAFIETSGFAELTKVVLASAVVQANPERTNPFQINATVMNIGHQTTITSDRPACGSELGGDPSGCAIMAAEIDAVYRGATPQQARATCGRYGIQYLVANTYDRAWNDRQGWVWTLPAVVNEPEFRAVDCRETR